MPSIVVFCDGTGTRLMREMAGFRVHKRCKIYMRLPIRTPQGLSKRNITIRRALERKEAYWAVHREELSVMAWIKI